MGDLVIAGRLDYMYDKKTTYPRLKGTGPSQKCFSRRIVWLCIRKPENSLTRPHWNIFQLS